jgi:hypothetical protein
MLASESVLNFGRKTLLSTPVPLLGLAALTPVNILVTCNVSESPQCIGSRYQIALKPCFEDYDDRMFHTGNPPYCV